MFSFRITANRSGHRSTKSTDTFVACFIRISLFPVHANPWEHDLLRNSVAEKRFYHHIGWKRDTPHLRADVYAVSRKTFSPSRVEQT